MVLAIYAAAAVFSVLWWRPIRRMAQFNDARCAVRVVDAQALLGVSPLGLYWVAPSWWAYVAGGLVFALGLGQLLWFAALGRR